MMAWAVELGTAVREDMSTSGMACSCSLRLA